MTSKKNKKVFVAMSGGVDSSVVAGMMKGAGHDVVGVTMCFSINHPGSRKPSCCGVDGIQDAQRAAQILGIPHYVLDFAKDIDEHIIEDFTNEYLSGRTPNPCVRCNQYLKFGTLYEKVKSLGADCLSTGHYARIEHNEAAGQFELKKAKDLKKDQSYFLYSMRKETLPSVLFPLGGLTKSEVRDLARKYKLNTAEKPESQDICFVPDAGYKKFLEDRVGGRVFQPGDFMDQDGKVVGQHKGIAYYTIGQRDKLGIALGHPVYVYKIEKETNMVYVGPETCLYSAGFYAGQFNPLSLAIAQETVEVGARIRYNAPETKAYLTCLSGGRVKVEFAGPQKSVTPGQSAVFYRGDVVLGGAIIDEPIPLGNGKGEEARIGLRTMVTSP
ncbi:MAG TPA: tRNA 2-thiouridine(34) synthase MnmA [Candidatus Omnitrophica bacterium]|nr:tRNA 2-thiouridine(34) synthase MnmA [Candidatus Omnitrophota bacterium]